MLKINEEKIGVIGLGYVGLPVAVAFAKKFKTIGFDVNQERISELSKGNDRTNEISQSELLASKLILSSDLEDLRGCSMFIVTVPTPVDQNRQPDLTAISKASVTVGKVISPGSVVVYESTVYPGVTEDICRDIIAKTSGLIPGKDFLMGYSPERINPGDKEHRLENILKIVSGENEEALERVANAYSQIISAGIHKAPSIKVAEAAKVIENSQRDINIAFMNELALIFDKMGIRTKDVLEAAGTKWNFLKFSPGLVGGHCIGVDPYYLTAKAENLGYHPEVILSGRRINDNMGIYIAQKLMKLLIKSKIPVSLAKVGILGLTFKENVPDLRNSRVPDIINELNDFGIQTFVCDPNADEIEAANEYGVKLSKLSDLQELDAIVFAVPHQQYMDIPIDKLCSCLKSNAIIIDIKSVLNPNELPSFVKYWSL